jgi:hypothetical protein
MCWGYQMVKPEVSAERKRLLLRWENFATHSIYSANVERLLLPDFIKVV